MFHSEPNIVSQARKLVDRGDAPAPLRLAVPHRPADFDLRLVPTSPWWRGGPLEDAAATLREAGLVSSWEARGAELRVLFSDDALRTAEPRLAVDGRDRRGLLVQLCDPNTTKALHLGHLRNIAIGNAIASMHEATGRLVTRQSVVCDFGRGVSEAMAGWVAPEHATAAYEKPDRAVGRRYARYVAGLEPPEPGVGPADQPVARETAEADDLAQQLLRGWLRGDPQVRELWTEVRALVLQGHGETMTRLGVRFDRSVYESEWCHLNEEIVRRGVESGLFSVTPQKDVVYRTGLEQQEELTLLRAGTFPTVHLRTLAVWVGIDPCLSGLEAILVGGDEWRTHDLCIEDMLARYLGEDRCCATPTHVTYGMVHQDGSLMKSSTGLVTLIDDILATMEGRTEAFLAALPPDHRRSIAAKALLGFFLGFPLQEKLEVDIDRLADPEENLALLTLHAWARARSEREGAEPTAEWLRDREVRWLLVQGHWTECCADEARERLDPRLAMRCNAYLAGWYLEGDRDPAVAAVAAEVLGRGLALLGLLPQGGADPGPSLLAGDFAADAVGADR